ncbi:hypothetical protein Goklo_001253 [Gossypium klotzschianum]|uniref:Uncharacterized protein n=1 Tax=Gossypium klotzschianum TaxID=34286 RepID=A0A7J8W120_9ROSI|nr:hypothetical protein [Gossypium klotzschianum]
MGVVGYAPLLVLRQHRSRQFTPVTQVLGQCEVRESTIISLRQTKKTLVQ